MDPENNNPNTCSTNPYTENEEIVSTVREGVVLIFHFDNKEDYITFLDCKILTKPKIEQLSFLLHDTNLNNDDFLYIFNCASKLKNLKVLEFRATENSFSDDCLSSFVDYIYNEETSFPFLKSLLFCLGNNKGINFEQVAKFITTLSLKKSNKQLEKIYFELNGIQKDCLRNALNYFLQKRDCFSYFEINTLNNIILIGSQDNIFTELKFLITELSDYKGDNQLSENLPHK
jgi:hypothetical protein